MQTPNRPITLLELSALVDHVDLVKTTEGFTESKKEKVSYKHQVPKQKWFVDATGEGRMTNLCNQC